MADPDVRIPLRYEEAFQYLADISDARFSALVAALRLVPEASLPADFAAAAASSDPDGDVGPRASNLVDALIGVQVLRSSQDLSLDEVVPAVVARAIGPTHVAEQRGQVLTTRLREALSVDAVWHVAKAFDMGTAYPRSLQNARIITDIRPIFRDPVSERPPTAVISHSLELRTYAEDGSQEALYVALDQADLEDLRYRVERALEKAATLRSLLEEWKIAVHRLEKQ